MENNINYDNHSFSVEMATTIGLEESIILQHLYYWCYGNSDNKEMKKDGYIWVYLSRKKIANKYPYISEGKIKSVMNKLKDNGYILISNYNKLAIDKTNWYALTDKAYKLFNTSLAKLTNDNTKQPTVGQNNQAIQSIKTIFNNKEIEDKSSIKKEDQIDYALIENEWNTICSKLPNVRGISPKRKTAIKNTLKNNNANANDLIKCFKIIASSDFLNGNNSRKWCATFDWITTDTKGCFNRLLEGEFSKSLKEHKLYEDIINDANIANKETNSKEITIINGIKYQ